MRTSLIPNLGFEYELSERPVPAIVRKHAARFAHILRLVPGFEEGLPIGEVPDPEAAVAWGMSARAAALAAGAAADWPDPAIVRLANDKRTSHALEQELGVALPGAAVAMDREELRRSAGAIGGPWIAKHPFGVSGRHAVRGYGLNERDLANAAELLEDGVGLVVEPLLEIEREISLHYDLASPGDWTYVGAALLLTDRHGAFRGNAAPLDDVPAPFLRTGDRVADALSARGYRGPMGIDAQLGSLSGRHVDRPIGEINARWTFGRLTLLLARRVPTGRIVWHHPPAGRVLTGSSYLPLPADLDPERRSGTYVEVLDQTP